MAPNIEAANVRRLAREELRRDGEEVYDCMRFSILRRDLNAFVEFSDARAMRIREQAKANRLGDRRASTYVKALVDLAGKTINEEIIGVDTNFVY